ncbi:A24 family peptidase [Pseudodesulfovibrio tunisiensis]|uniref:A24 family peptidase n=1 Tax=Pseudodesulfovibrio tunisiensis TaxID=463192 RepID=UPI001FB41F2A|nr:prepilin peptidase [Pseudodesulfovibrio tunisiensis]
METGLMRVVALSAAGLALGSFAGCVTCRHAAGTSVLSPARSFCPKCGTTLSWFENIPILGFCLLRGHCRHCGKPIDAAYPLIELAFFLSAILIAVRGLPVMAWAACMGALLLLAVAWTEEMRLGRVAGMVPAALCGAALIIALTGDRPVLSVLIPGVALAWCVGLLMAVLGAWKHAVSPGPAWLAMGAALVAGTVTTNPWFAAAVMVGTVCLGVASVRHGWRIPFSGCLAAGCLVCMAGV